MKGTIETYRENIIKEGIRRALHYSIFTRVLYDELSNFVYKDRFNKHSENIKKLHNIHIDKRCFIVATGPSLNKTNLKLIENEIKIGVNTAFKTGLDFDYYVVSDRIMWDVYSEELLALDTNMFLGYVASRHFLRNYADNGVNVIMGKKTIKLPSVFPNDISKYIYVYAPTVIYLTLQIAYYLGFKEVYLLGCDSDYSHGHFDGKQFVKTSKIQDIQSAETSFWNTIFDAYKVCKKVYEDDNRKIYNSTVGGKLEVFERRRLENIDKKE